MLTLYLAFFESSSDKNNFEKMFLTFRKQMLAYAMTLLDNRCDAEDAVHNVFLRIAQSTWETVKSLEDENDLRNYLLKATRNASLNIMKVRLKESVPFSDADSYRCKELLVSDKAFLNTVCDQIDYEQLLRALKTMNVRYRYVLYYHFVLASL